MTRIRLASQSRIALGESALNMLGGRIRNAFAMKISAMESALQVLQARIHAADPRKVLERGYVLALDSAGVALKTSAGMKAGDKVSVLFRDGVLDCSVDAVVPKNK